MLNSRTRAQFKKASINFGSL